MAIQTIDINSPVSMTTALKIAYKPQQFLRSMCKAVTHATKSFIFDVEKKTRVMAPYVRDYADAELIERDGYETLVYTPPKVNPARDLTSKDLERRSVGQNVVDFDAGSANEAQYFNNIIIADLLDMQASIERREEQQIAEILTTGQLVTGVSDTIVLPIPSENFITLSGNDLFNKASANPIQWMRGVKRNNIGRNGGGATKRAIFGASAWDAFEANANVQKQLNLLHMKFGEVEARPEQMFEGVTYQGTIQGVDLYTYDEWFYNDLTKSDSPIIPEDRVFMIGTNAQFEMHYGAVFDGANGTVNKVQSYVTTYIKNGKERWTDIESHPLFLPKNGAGVVSAKVV